MRKSTVFSRRLTILASLACTLLVSSCDKDDDDDNNTNQMYTLSGNASGNQMVPSVSGTGTGTISGSYNANTNTLNYTTNWTGLTGAPTGGGFYAGNSGQAGTLVGSNWTMGSNLTSTGTHSGQMTLTDAQETQFLNGGWYYSMRTAANTGGEIRGQITATR
ncbi:MAG: hypothetical protein JWP69_1565 [Flaviaesturariibacter sp.]|nr:hypothetical protein [Flaviaesturariibacter sp.]